MAETTAPGDEVPTYAQVVGAVNRRAVESDYALTAAGGLPGELNINWLSKGVGTFDCEYGFSCMGYEIAGAWGAKLARPDGEVVCFVGDGSYLMLNSELHSSVIAGQKLIVIVCDNGGFAVIDRLQTGMGGRSFNNMFGDEQAEGRLGRPRDRARLPRRGGEPRSRSSRTPSSGRAPRTARP